MSDLETTEPQRGRGARAALIVPLTRPRSTRDPSHQRGNANNGHAASANWSAPPPIAFDHLELRTILHLYGRMVAKGEWRDYAIDFLLDKAVFSIFRRTSDVPLYRIEKDPKLARRQGAYTVVAATGLILKRGHELQRVLRVLEKPLRVVAG